MSTEKVEEKLANKKSRKSKGSDVSTQKEVDRVSPGDTAKITSKKSKRGKVEEENGETDKATKEKLKKRKHVDDGGDIESDKKKKRRGEANLNESQYMREDEVESEKSKELKDFGHYDTKGKKKGTQEGSRKKGWKKEKIGNEDSEPIKRKQPKTDSCTGLPDPEGDSSLAKQAHKALTYAHQQFDDPTNWKFNKARQNWLIRNIWSDQAIPELYMPLLTRYLANVKGGVREKLVTNCQSIISSSLTTPTDPTPVTTMETEVEMKQLRARKILDVITAGAETSGANQ